MQLNRPQEYDLHLRPNAKLAQALDSVIPPPMEFNTVKMGPAGERQTISVHSEGSNTYGQNNNIIRFKPASSKFLDFRRATLAFKCSATSDGTYVRFVNGIWNLFERERVFWNGKLIYDNHEKNMYRSMNFAMSRDRTVDAAFGEIWGLGDNSERESWVAGKNYQIPLNITVLEQEELPAWKFRELKIELTLASPNKVLETDGTTFTFTVEDPHLILDEVEYEPSWHNIVDSQDLFWAHPTYECYTFSNTSSNFQANIPHKSQGIERVFCVIKHTDHLTDTTVNNRYYTFSHDDCKEYQFKIGNSFFPREPVKSSNTSIGDPDKFYPAYYNYLNNCHRTFLNDSLSDTYRVNLDIPYNNFKNLPITPAEFTTDKFVMTLDFMTFLYNSNDFISKQDWTGNENKVMVNINFNSAPAQKQTIFFFIVYKSVLAIPRDGNAYKIE